MGRKKTVRVNRAKRHTGCFQSGYLVLKTGKQPKAKILSFWLDVLIPASRQVGSI